ncbi:MAG: hypothetical protein ABL956_10950 [Hyphomonadaceae bacterium]
MTSPTDIWPEYADVQLRFAERVAALSGRPLTEVSLYFTNFHRRLGLGVAGTGEPAAAWKAVVAEAFMWNLTSLYICQPWLSFPCQLLSASASFAAFMREYGV